MKKKHQLLVRGFRKLVCRPGKDPLDEQQSDAEKQAEGTDALKELAESEAVTGMDTDTPHIRPHARRHVSFFDEATTAVPTEGPTRPPSIAGVTEEKLNIASPTPTIAKTDGTLSRPLTPVQESAEPPSKHSVRARKALKIMKSMARSFCMPASLAIVISFPIALINPLKALFVEVDGYYMHPAPDGEPPLGVIYDFAEFVGAAAVPLNLICLGSALARLNVPRSQWPNLPLGAISWLAIGRMLLMPIFGVLICEGLIHVNFIAQDDKVLQFVCMYVVFLGLATVGWLTRGYRIFSCLPTATTQVFITQVYSGTGEAEHLSAFLIPQYILMFLSMTVLSAYALHILF